MSANNDNNINVINISNDDLPNLEDTLTRELPSNGSNFNVVHFNAESIPGHFRDILITFCTNNIHIQAILISETFLKPHMDNISPTLYNLPGYNLIRNDRYNRAHGGVAIYLREDIAFECVRKSPYSEAKTAEYIFVIVALPVRVLLGVYYSPDRTIDYFDSLQCLLQEFRSAYDEAIIMGDLNTCQLLNNSRKRKLLSVLNSVELKVLQLLVTHRKPMKNPSLIDLIIVSNENNVLKYGQLPTCFSYHDLIYVTYTIQGMPPMPPPSTWNTIQPSMEEQIIRRYRLKYKSSYNDTGNTTSLQEYKKWHKIWMKHERICKKITIRQIIGGTYRPRHLNYLQQFLIEQQVGSFNYY